MHAHRIALGKIGRPRGVRGAMFFWPYNKDSDALEPGLTVYVGDESFVLDDVRFLPNAVEIALASKTT